MGREPNSTERSLFPAKYKFHIAIAAFPAYLLCGTSFPVSLLQKKTVDRLSAQVAGRLNFEYKDPHRNFDRSRVKGLVAKLVQVKDPSHSTALEVAAGGRLYQASRTHGGVVYQSIWG